MKYLFEQINDPFYPTPKEVVQQKLELLELKDGETLVDLGCGDARSLIMACAMANVNCIGYEILPEAIAKAHENIKKAGLQDRIQIIEDSMFNADISKVDAIILYLSRNPLGQLSLKLEQELPKGARIITHDFDIPAWKAEKEMTMRNALAALVPLYLYRK